MQKEQKAILELANEVLIPEWQKEREFQKKLEDWAKGEHARPYRPRETNGEYDAIEQNSKVPLLGLIVRIFGQGLELIDYAPGDEKMKDDLWKIWMANQMPSRQKRLWKAAFTGGVGYALALPGDPLPQIKLYSAKNMIAVYQDPEYDEWPMYAAEGTPANSSEFHFRVFDDTKVHTLGMNAEGGNVKFITSEEHGAGVTPVVRFAGEVDTEGAAEGEVERLIPIQAAIDQAKFDLQMTQTFSSFKIRYATGMAAPDNEDDAERVKLILAQDRILLSENSESKFGTLDGTDLQGYIESGKASKQELATIAQVSPKAIVGAQANTANGAEAQAADEASTMRKLSDFETVFSPSIGQLNRLTGALAGIEGAGADYNGRCTWRDSEIRSLAQIADAVAKLADDRLAIPREALWEMLPGVTPDKVKAWKSYEGDAFSELLEGIGRGSGGAVERTEA
ncbi:phage portal protein [Leucobacter rhizosphaerae]|uniref:Phage portal protein n=1 Tax=Leucobacter rhizosphaerae TaxID=2932245 RepID=A0ABY4G0X0_9MICO|nr:phage portal protein [Leucobacter rhizosphaerae]UOQ61949.1 phage portal protein [Leucobacter rhizosphaerae]